VLLQLVAECRFITPNRITVASIAVCTAASVAIVEGHIVIAIALIGIRSVLDSLDGQLARYRACGTNLGSYVDKVSDLYCWAALFAALGVRAYAAQPTSSMLLLPCLSAIALALLGFSLWFVRALSTTPVAAGAPSPLGARAWLASWWRIVLFEEPDFYLWIALALATARFDIFIPFIAGAYVVRALALVIVRAHLVRDVFRTTGKELQA
jgi:phosphatidylglycerophosphate synthase